MSKGNRPAVCVSSGKRLRAKSWYYRDGKYFYNKGAWRQEHEKQMKETAAKAAAVSEAAAAAPAEPKATPQGESGGKA